MDIENAPETALADKPSPPGDLAAAPEGARWRQRPVAERAASASPSDDVEPATDTATAPKPQRAPRDIELRMLARRAQGAALRLDFELRTALVRQVFRRDFVYVSRQLHALEASRRVQGLSRTSLADAVSALQRHLDELHGWIDHQASELQAAIAARAPAGARIAFACPARFQATIVSPAAHRFLALLLQADGMLALLEMAWLLGLVDPGHRTRLARDCRRALLDFKNLACERRQAIGQLVREVNAQREDAPPMIGNP